MLCLHFYITITPPPPPPQPTHNLHTPRSVGRLRVLCTYFPILIWKWFHFAFLLSHVSARLDALRLALFFILQGANSLYFAGA